MTLTLPISNLKIAHRVCADALVNFVLIKTPCFIMKRGCNVGEMVHEMMCFVLQRYSIKLPRIKAIEGWK